ncbi:MULTISPECIES: NUDIX hydrolase [Brachybacterium]|uniref:ADP-ribose pyrophosphatase YjhB (NUDIX family) n=1 Tax=Brachybacterium fresconis TaxID=173363 RepID=A0ABS4YMP7_9MICO|nr:MULTISPECIES: NUDIX domain-containing protein [Brachybacterium]APX34949.1 ADP-ribose pyrophosphatase [Brachybacterium sp. P6-10-X1]MBP2410033.1 ADP-ribose pyrophosphatase YjhB (NUDIX family) [Brachybacterium fresconis]
MNDPISLAVSTVIFALRPHPTTRRLALWVPLVRRIRAPHQGRWALPGGPLTPDEGLAASAARNLRETTQLTPQYLEQLYAFGGLDRAPTAAERTVSVVYWALVRPEEADAGAAGVNVQWFVADEVPELAFDHSLIVQYALWRLRNKVEYSRIAAAFLGESFTLAELRGVHEAVLQRTLDPANFRRQMEASGRLVATDAFRTGGRHRPARLYRHDRSIHLADNGPLTGQ